ncbi:hypothetical protein IV203_037911 [Nitzschia inconspicua]|uniref:Uncharacterized protein n=1 Tax=Nitzschia inconspicua TaxID=303405 RepID=A0A9K3Q1F1_9STRA|nr:hypothetical protein IV203_037911 [Nitzschia inconspicua]
MRLSVGVAILASASSSMAHRSMKGEDHHYHRHHDHLKPHTHVAYHHVESACAEDVELLCSPEPDMLFSLPHPSSGDPFLDWVLFAPPSDHPPPELQDFPVFMNRLFDSVLEPRSPQISILWFEQAEKEEPHMVIDSAVSRLATDMQPEEIPLLAHQLQHFGQEILRDVEIHDERHRRMARRLTEMDSGKVQLHASLPYGCSKNRCLREAFAEHKVSNECARSMEILERTFSLENELDRRQEIFIVMMWIYIAALASLMLLVGRNYQARRGRRRLKQKIILAVYSNPAIRKQVEEELGESVGDVPPLSYHVMRMITAGGSELKRRLRCVRRIHAFFLVGLMTLVFVAPFWVLPICILVTMVRVAQIGCINDELEAEDCASCCCAASPGMAKAGLLTEEQACCGCCKGTGICSQQCASCCVSAGCCSCCCSSCCNGKCCCAPSQMKYIEEDCTCCCCGASASMAKAGLLTDKQACCNCCKGTGKCSAACASCCGNGCDCNGSDCCCCDVTVNIEDDCTCCCCGASASVAKAGLLTIEQACCNCCKGTGKCSASCASCCDNGCDCNGKDCCCCDGDKKVCEKAVYEGIPIQIV